MNAAHKYGITLLLMSILILLCLWAGSVMVKGSTELPKPVNTIVETPSVEYSFGAIQTVHEFTLQDGTRCVLFYGGGINCNWSVPHD